MSHPLRLLSLRFPAIPLRPHRIPQFRGGVIESAGRAHDLFHNHKPDGSNDQRPALIQYRVAQGCAAIWGIGEGALALERWWLSAPDALHFGGQSYPLQAAEVRRENFQLGMAPHWKYYRLHDYLALNTENYLRWLDTPQLVGRAKLLDSILVGHLLGLCETADWQLPERLEAQVVDIHRRRKTRYHNTDLMAFEITYRCNILLPEGIALGKAVSHGFGVQWPVRKLEENPGTNNTLLTTKNTLVSM